MEIRRSCRNDSNWMDREDAAPFQEGLLPHPSAKSAYEWGTRRFGVVRTWVS